MSDGGQVMHIRNVLGCWSLCAIGLISPPLAATELQPGLLLGDNRVWLMAQDGGVACVAVDNGEELWISRDIAQPVGISESQLLALRETTREGLSYAWVEADSGQRLAVGRAELPEGVRVLIDERLGESFAINANDSGFDWHYRRSEVRGAPESEDDNMAKRSASVDNQGAFRIDWSKRAVIESRVDIHKAPPRAAEIGTPDAATRRFRSQSDAFRLASERQADGRYRWTISTAQGETLGAVTSDYSYRPFDVIAGRLLFVTPLSMRRDGAEVALSMPTLVAYDLANGERVWQRELRDTRYRGPYPP